jgi:oligopeptide transport system permease protein
MLTYLVRRVLWLVPVVFVVALVTFLLMHQAPGGPWDSDKPVAPATLRNLNRKFGLDKPRWVNLDAVEAKRDEGVINPLELSRALVDSQFGNYMLGVARFDLGPTYQSRGAETVQSEIRDRLPASIKVGLVAIVFAVAVGLPLGVASALRQNSWIDYLCLSTATLGISVPTFVSGILLLIVLSRGFDVSPVKRPEAWEGFGPAYLAPGIVLGLGTMAYLARLTRATMLEIKRQDFVRTARAKGLRETRIVSRHMLRNALIPIVTVLGPAAADLLTGSFIIEQIFSVPGLGHEFVASISRRDYSMIMGLTIFYAILIALANLTVDLSYGLLDPRIRARR